MTEKFKDLLDIFRMMQPVSVAAADRLASSSTATNTFWKQFFDLMLRSDASGAESIRSIGEKINQLMSGKDSSLSAEARYVFRMYTKKQDQNLSIISPPDDPGRLYDVEGGKPKYVSTLAEVFKFSESSQQDFALIMCNSPLLSPATRNIDKTEMWLNYVPSIVMSRCVPYIDVKFEMQRPQTDDPTSARPEAFSVLKFLEGAAAIKPTQVADYAMLKGDSRVIPADSRGKSAAIYASGMEAFLTPQTLVNPNSVGFNDRYVDVIDKFRPLASLQGLELSINPMIGFMTYKNGTLSFVLHDRSRLHEISDAIRPQLYHGVTIWITYGWRHPTEPNNPYANFINNNMLMREAFNIVNVDMNFDDVGQATIKLKIATAGAKELSITSAPSAASANFDKLQIIRDRVKFLRSQLRLAGDSGISKEVRSYQLLDAVESGIFLDLSDKETTEAIDKLYQTLIQKQSTKVDGSGSDVLQEQMKVLAEELKLRLKEYHLDATSDGKNKVNLKKLIASTSRQATLERFDSIVSKPDPFLLSEDKLKNAGDLWPSNQIAAPSKEDLIKGIKRVNSDKNVISKEFTELLTPKGTQVKDRQGVVSLGKLFTTFVIPTVEQLSDVNETQLIFYQLNGNCGPASNLNIAEFPIEVDKFLKKYSDVIYNKKSDMLTLPEFFSIIDSTHVKDVRSIAYGLSQYYESYDLNNPEPQVKKNENDDLADALRQRELAYGVFQLPNLQIHVETLHARKDGNTSVDLLDLIRQQDHKDNNLYQKIVRIHVYDKTLNPYQAESMLLRPKTSPEGSIGRKLYQVNARTAEGLYEIQKLVNQLNQLKQAGGNQDQQQVSKLETQLITTISSRSDITQKGPLGEALSGNDRREIRKFISRNMPTIIYGANGSTVTSLSVSTKSDSLVDTSNMIKAFSTGPTMSPNGSGQFGLPLRVIPATMTMTSYGCPLAAAAQVFFVDLNTGTTLDNQYIATNVTHTLASGKFETSWTFAYLDGYATLEGAPAVIDSTIRVLDPTKK